MRFSSCASRALAAFWAAFLLPAIAVAAGTGNCGQRYIAPAASTYTAAGSDDGTLISAGNATGAPVGSAGASIKIALPQVTAVASGWTLCAVSDANKAPVFASPSLTAPAAPTLGSVSGGTIGATTYFVEITYTNLAGETIASAEASLAVGANHLLTIATPGAFGNATGWNVYVATGSGLEELQTSSPLSLGSNWTEPMGGLVTGAAPPSSGTAPSAYILAGGQSLAAMTIGPLDSAVTQLQSDGANYRVISSAPQAFAINGMVNGLPDRWEYPGGSGYQATQGDNKAVISSAFTSAGLAVTLPSASAISAGWTVAVSADAQPLSVRTNAANGGNLYLSSGAAVTTQPYALPAGSSRSQAMLQFDGANFHLFLGGEAVATTAQLRGLTGGTTMWSLGFHTLGDMPRTQYVWQPSCPGTPDNVGFYIAPTAGGGGCYVNSSAIINFGQFGAFANSMTDSSAAIAAAFNDSAPGSTFDCAGNFYTIAATVAITKKTHLVHCGGRSSFSVLPGVDSPVGFYAGASNLNPMFDIQSGGNTWEDFYLNMQFNGVTNTSGVGIVQEAAGGIAWGTFKNGQIDYACNIISINGILDTVQGLSASQQGGGSLCFGVEIGNLTTNGATNEPHLDDISVQSNASNLPAANVALFDSSGTLATRLSSLGGVMCGTCIIPGANQNSSFISISHSNFGDALGIGPALYINPQASTAKGALGLTFDDDWASSSASSDGVLIQNTNGSKVDTISFTLLRAYNNHPYGVYIDGVASGTPPSNITITGGSQICGNGATTGAGVYVNDAAVVPPANVKIIGNKISALCGGQQAASQEYGIFVAGGAANNLTIRDNDLDGNFLIAMPPAQIITGTASISNNTGITGNFPTLMISSGAVTNFGVYDEIAIGGTGVLTTLDPGWAWRMLTILDTGTWTIGTGGNFCAATAPFTPIQNLAYRFQWRGDLNCWTRVD